MITNKIDISGLNRHELAELRDEIVFELDLHDAEMRAFYGVGIVSPPECEECGDKEWTIDELGTEIDDFRNAIYAATDLLSAAIKRLEREL